MRPVILTPSRSAGDQSMRPGAALCCLAALALASPLHVSALTIVPKPQYQAMNATVLTLDAKRFTFAATGNDSPLLQAAFTRYAALLGRSSRGLTSAGLADQRSLDWLRSTGLLTAAEFAALTARVPASHPTDPAGTAGIISGADVAVATLTRVKTLDTDESYTLHVAAPRIQITAATVYGAIYALESLSQLLDLAGCINATFVDDKPRFAFRATMIDTARHWYAIPAIKQHLDAMAAVKMNVMHWHVVDSQSFPFVSGHVPALSRGGAWQPDHVYTAKDVRDIVAYANERGIRVIPEFDTPGHVAAGWESLGVLTGCPDSATGGRGTHPLNPTLNETYKVLTALWGDVLDAFSPESFVHIGGDEVWHTNTTSCWTTNPQVQAWLKANPDVDGFAGLEEFFERKVLAMLHKAGASVLVWQEIFDNGAHPPSDTLIDVWKTTDDGEHFKAHGYQGEMAAVTAAGYRAILSAPFYLNMISYGMDWWTYYQVQPANFTGGAAAEAAKQIAGIKAHYWSEFIDPANFIPRAWPRTAAIAERAWSAKEVRDGVDAQARLHELRCKLLTRGINAEPIGICANPNCTKHGKGHMPGGVFGPFPGVGGYCPQEWVPTYAGIGAA